MSWLILIITGAVIGFLASLISKTGYRYGLLADIVIGIIGALLGRLIFFDLLGIGSAAAAGSFSFYGILWGVIGALIVIAIIRLVKAYWAGDYVAGNLLLFGNHRKCLDHYFNSILFNNLCFDSSGN